MPPGPVPTLGVASHPRSFLRHRHTTIPEHMPSAHRRYVAWTPVRMMREAGSIGPAIIALMEAVMKARPHPERGFRAGLGILHLASSLRLADMQHDARCEQSSSRLWCGRKSNYGQGSCKGARTGASRLRMRVTLSLPLMDGKTSGGCLGSMFDYSPGV